jgi:transcriptional regulator with XRE-family HTH domain
MTLQQPCAARGLTLEPLAERAGIALATVLELAAGTLRAQPSTRARLAAVLVIDPETLRDALSATRRGRESAPLSGTEWR